MDFPRRNSTSSILVPLEIMQLIISKVDMATLKALRLCWPDLEDHISCRLFDTLQFQSQKRIDEFLGQCITQDIMDPLFGRNKPHLAIGPFVRVVKICGVMQLNHISLRSLHNLLPNVDHLILDNSSLPIRCLMSLGSDVSQVRRKKYHSKYDQDGMGVLSAQLRHLGLFGSRAFDNATLLLPWYGICLESLSFSLCHGSRFHSFDISNPDEFSSIVRQIRGQIPSVVRVSVKVEVTRVNWRRLFVLIYNKYPNINNFTLYAK
ncbi:hypothetical protein BC940DRAFT_320636 [Gongronella butleri]|nr:hypothetical protein BC940DRAFT_320636 [Gongronella butleri]